jgi:alpha-glucosidase (family GH31 glycosyl hydrolase)
VALGVAAPPAAGATVVDAGALKARVSGGAWGLELTDARGRRVLAELASAEPSAPGRLGFRTAQGWQHATRILGTERQEGAFLAQLETTDPSRTIELRLARAGEGVIALDAHVAGPAAGIEAVGIAFAARPRERFLGFGERSNGAVHADGVIENYVSDGPYQQEEYAPIGLFVPAWGLRDGRQDATYYPVPWLLSSSGYGVLVDNPETSYFRLRAGGAAGWSVEVAPVPEGEAAPVPAPAPDRLRLRFFAGPRPANALRRLTRETGRQPAPAPWVLGPWFQAADDEQAEVAALRRADAPLSALQTYLHYLPCGDQVGGPDQRSRTAAAHAAGVAITTYFNPMICTDYQPAYDQAAQAGALTADQLGRPYVYRYGADLDQAFFVSQFDFFAEAGAAQYAALLAEAVDAGYDGWMEDFGEYTPLDSVSAGAIPGSQAHNPYPTRYHCAARTATRGAQRPIVRFQRSGWTGSAACAPVVWGGDPTTGWGFDGLRSAVSQALSAGSSGIGIWGSDIGGFFALGSNRLSPELLTRWVQLGAVSPVMRTQANGVAVPPKDRPQVTDADQLANWRRYAKLHTQLYPYLAAATRAYRRRGMPPMRQLALAYPRDRRGAGIDDEFLLGPDLLVAPVLEPAMDERALYVPPGRWVDLWRSAAYREGSGAIVLREATILRGRRYATVPSPLAELPILVRAGAVLPLLPPEVDTLAGYGSAEKHLVSLGERRDRLRLLAFPRGRSGSRFYAGERLRSLETRDGWRLEIGGDRRRAYRLDASLETLRHPFSPCRVEVNGRALGRHRWSFDRQSGVLTARFSGRAPALRALGRGCG